MKSTETLFGKPLTSIQALERFFLKKSSPAFTQDSEERTLALFHQMAKRVPAYQQFLQDHKIQPESILSFEDLLEIPPTDKDNYVNRYPLNQLCWDGKLDAHMFSTSSGSSGKTQFWPRTHRLELETATIYELLLKNFFEIDKKKTLLINAYSMGLYVAGTFTLNSCMRIADKGYPLTTITPGINKQDIIKVIQAVGDQFEQIILCAYPPLAKDIIDEGIAAGIDWSHYSLHFISGGESYSEGWRANLYKHAGVDTDRYLTSSINTYGSADAAILGHETPLSILIRTYASKNKALCEELFGRRTVPSLHQYYPFWKNISLYKNELCFSANAGIPLLRYNIHDVGNTYTYNQIIRILKKHGVSSKRIEADLPAHFLWKLPFVYLFGRSDQASTIYGLNIYPENIKEALEQETVMPNVSGKFFISTEFDRKQNQYLKLKIELRKNVSLDRKTTLRIKKVVFDTLREVNAEYKVLSEHLMHRAKPRISFHTHGDERHFPTQIKQRYLK